MNSPAKTCLVFERLVFTQFKFEIERSTTVHARLKKSEMAKFLIISFAVFSVLTVSLWYATAVPLHELKEDSNLGRFYLFIYLCLAAFCYWVTFSLISSWSLINLPPSPGQNQLDAEFGLTVYVCLLQWRIWLTLWQIPTVSPIMSSLFV